MRVEAQEVFGTDRVPLRVFQKVWVVPGDANSVHEKTREGEFAFVFRERLGVRETDRACSVTSCKLGVLCEGDYLAMNQHRPSRIAAGG